MKVVSRLTAAEAQDLPDPEIWEAPNRLTRDELTAHGGVETRRPWRATDDLEDDQ